MSHSFIPCQRVCATSFSAHTDIHAQICLSIYNAIIETWERRYVNKRKGRCHRDRKREMREHGMFFSDSIPSNPMERQMREARKRKTTNGRSQDGSHHYMRSLTHSLKSQTPAHQWEEEMKKRKVFKNSSFSMKIGETNEENLHPNQLFVDSQRSAPFSHHHRYQVGHRSRLVETRWIETCSRLQRALGRQKTWMQSGTSFGKRKDELIQMQMVGTCDTIHKAKASTIKQIKAVEMLRRLMRFLPQQGKSWVLIEYNEK